jgi:putative transposase
MILDYINHTVIRSRVKLGWVVTRLGLQIGTYYRWRRREAGGELEDKVVIQPNLDAALPAEVEAVIRYALQHPRDGYRRLAYMMMDEDVACLSPSSVYRILSSEDLLYRFKQSSKSSGKYEFKPERPHDQWHTDIMYLWVHSRWYFFVGVLDAWSRYLVHWELLETVSAQDVTAVLQSALKKYRGVKPRIVSDNGPQFKSRDFRHLLKEFSLLDIKIRIRHPESNGVQERLHRSLREEGLSDADLKNKHKAISAIEKWVDYYNHRRLHAGLGYIRPVDYLNEMQNEIRRVRRQKLADAAKARRKKNRELFAANNIKDQKRDEESDHSGGSTPTPPGFIALGENSVCVKTPSSPKEIPARNHTASASFGARVPSPESHILQRMREANKKEKNCQGC